MIPLTNLMLLRNLKRFSSPGLRKYTGYKEMPRVIEWFRYCYIISTSKGVMTNKRSSRHLRLVVKFYVMFINSRRNVECQE